MEILRRSLFDSFQLRHLITIAGEIQAVACTKPICKIILFDGRRHHNFIKHHDLQVTPFLDVAQRALSQLPNSTKKILQDFEKQAATMKLWREKSIFKNAISLQSKK